MFHPAPCRQNKFFQLERVAAFTGQLPAFFMERIVSWRFKETFFFAKRNHRKPFKGLCFR
jgi:hypothetical protein